MMVARKTRVPRLDLLGHGASSLTFHCRLPSSNSVRGLFSDLLEEDQDVLSLSTYVKNSSPYLVTERFESGEPDPEGFFAYVEYELLGALPSEPPPEEVRREGVVFERLRAMAEPIRLHCHVAFEFSPEDPPRVITAFPLPWPFPERDDSPIDEIRGIRGVKYLGEGASRTQYSFIMDRPSNQTVYLTVTFFRTASVTARTLGGILRSATNVADRLVRKAPVQRSVGDALDESSAPE